MGAYFLPLISRKTIAEGTMAFEFKKPKNFAFRAGQSIDMTIGTQVYPFSIAASPNEPILRIATRMRTESKFKNKLKKLPIGTKVRIQGPSGDFVLPKNTKKRIVMIAGGIGITPFYSMITSRPPHKISLFYKNSSPARAAFLDELKTFQVSGLKFKVVPIFKHVNIETFKPSPSAIYYLCGPPGFVAKYRAILDEAGVDEDNIRTEEFDGYT